jgi:acylphosphatase
MHKLIAHVSGKVQMAGYRSKVVTIAKTLDLKGYVRNLPDGRVKIAAEGSDEDIERFLKAIRIENTLIEVEDIKAELSDASGAYDDFFKIAGERETDERLDVAAEHLKELIAAVRDGFKEANFSLSHINSSLGSMDSKLGSMDSKLDHMDSKLDHMDSKLSSMDSKLGVIVGKQCETIAKIDEAREDVVSEVEGLRSDLKGRMEDRLLRIENDVAEIKARMKL